MALAFKADSRFIGSPTLWMTTILVIIYVTEALLGGSIFQPDLSRILLFMQVNAAVWHGAIWMLFTSMFLHGGWLH